MRYERKLALTLGTALMIGLAPVESQATGPTQIQCLQQQNSWISQCMDGWYGWWTSMSGQLDNCVGQFDAAHPECVNAGVGATAAAQEIHEAYGPQGEIIGGAVGIVGGMVGDLFQCAAGAGVVIYVSAETGTIIVTGEGFGDGSVSDETLEQLTQSCWNTATNAGIFVAAIVAPEVVAGVIIGDLSLGMYDCYDACINTSDHYACTEACYQQGAEALALLGFLYAGNVISEVLPPEMLAPEAFGYELRPGGIDVSYRESCRMPEEGTSQGPECLDEFFSEFRSRLGDPEYTSNTLVDYGFSEVPYFETQLEMLNAEAMTRFGGEFELQGQGLTYAELLELMGQTPPGTHGLGVGHGLPGEPNHGFYVGSGPGGVSTVGSMGHPWPTYDLYVYEPPLTPPPPGPLPPPPLPPPPMP